MALQTYSLDSLTDRYRGVIRGLKPSADTSPPSPWYIAARLCAVLHHSAQAAALYVLRQIMPKDAAADWILEHAQARGLELLPAAKATGKIAVVGSAASTQLTGSALTAPDGAAYVTTSGATLATPAFAGKTCGTGSTATRLVVMPDTSSMNADEILSVNGEQRAIREVVASANAVDLYEALSADPAPATAISAVTGDVVPIQAVTAGAAGQKLPGETLTLSSPGAGVTAATRLVECSGGGDAETIEELRARVIAYDRTRPAPPNAAWYRELARTTPGVRLSDAFVYPGFRGLGTVDVYPWGVSGARQPGSATVAAVQARIDAVRGPSDDVLVSAFSYDTPSRLDVEVFVHPSHEPDWIGSRTIGGGVSTTTRIYVTTDPTGVIDSEDRILVPVQSPSGVWHTYERVVNAVAPTYIEFADPLPAAPANGDLVTPSGPSGQAIVDAIEALWDNLGPGVYFRVSSPQAETWWERVPGVDEAGPGTVYVNGIIATLRDVEGTADADVLNLAGTSGVTLADKVAIPATVLRLGKFTVQLTKASP